MSSRWVPGISQLSPWKLQHGVRRTARQFGRCSIDSTALQALEHDKANDLMFWASSYNLFVTWSVNGQHPWDNVSNASKPAATLEIGSLRGTNKVCAHTSRRGPSPYH